MVPGLSIPIIPNIFHITFVLNPGAAFGILEHQTAFLVVVAGIMVAAVLYFYPHIPHKDHYLLRLGIGLMMGGAIGNVIDRVKTGYVIDFFDFRIWPVFNIADMSIVIGVGCIILHMMNLSDKEDDKS
jgi:signal peptidase II